MSSSSSSSSSSAPYFSLPTTNDLSYPGSSSHSLHPKVFDPNPSRSRLKFLAIRLILPLTGLALILLITLPNLSSSIPFSFNDCSNGDCLRWPQVHDLATSWRLGFQNSFHSSSNQNVGPSHSPLNILHLIDKDTAEVLMDRWLLHSHDACQNRTDLFSSAVLWGPEFEGWNGTESLTENVRRRYGAADYFDGVLIHFNNDQNKFLHIDPKPWFAQLKELSQQGKGVVLIDRPHEMRDLRKAEFYSLANITLVLAPYAYELFEYRPRFMTQTLMVHQPHFIDKQIFYHPVTDSRPEEIIIAGDLGAFYPFRARLAEMIRNKTLPGWIRGHPGYEEIKSADQRNKALNAQTQEQQLIDFGRDFGRAKICLVTDSRWAYSVQKYVEAAAAGCMIAGNIPLDRQSMFRKVIVPLTNKDSDDSIVKTLTWWLTHHDERLKKAKEAQDWILNSFSMENYAADVWKWIWMVKDGQRGMVLPYEFDFLPDPLPLDG